MQQRNLDQHANVLWIPGFRATRTATGAEKKSFSRLEDAIRFIMVELPEDVRNTAWITLDRGAIHGEEIKLLYETLPPKT